MAPNLLFGTSASTSVNTSNQQSDVNTSIQQSDAAFASANLYWDQLEFDESLYYSSPLKARSTTKKSYKRSVKKNWGDIVDTFCKIFDSATNFVSTFWDRITGNKVNPSYNLVGYGYQTVGGNVQELQKLLNQQGYALAEDGIWGRNTYNAVVNFQRSKGLVADGIVGYNTWTALYN